MPFPVTIYEHAFPSQRPRSCSSRIWRTIYKELTTVCPQVLTLYSSATWSPSAYAHFLTCFPTTSVTLTRTKMPFTRLAISKIWWSVSYCFCFEFIHFFFHYYVYIFSRKISHIVYPSLKWALRIVFCKNLTPKTAQLHHRYTSNTHSSKINTNKMTLMDYPLFHG